jgi:pimeloyl-ACP methyl ester carboxylesterase
VRSVDGLVHDDFVRDSLGAIQVPTAILFGGDDRLIPNPFLHGGKARDVMAYGAANIQGSTLVELEGCGHSVQLDCPAAYNAALQRFLAGLGSAGGASAPQ